MKRFIFTLVCLLLIVGCAGIQTKPQEVNIPIAALPNKIQIDPCPALPIDSLKPTDDWTVRLHSWSASVDILRGCVDSRDEVINEFNKTTK